MRNPHDIIIRPLVTEKAVNLAQEQNKYVFFVDRNANKIEIRNAIEEIFNVKIYTLSPFFTCSFNCDIIFTSTPGPI
jgi:large subunit ribosomal protein L23